MGLEDIIKFFVKYSEPGQLKSLMFILAIAMPVYILFNLSRVIDSIDSFRKREQAVIKDYFDKDVPKDANTEKVILDIREARYFKSIVGIYAEERFRHALIKLHADLSPKVDWLSIRKALRYLRERDGQIEVRFTLSAFIAYLFYAPLYLLVGFIILILIQQFFQQPVVFIQQPNKIAYFFVYSLLFWVLLREIWMIHSAIRIWEKLNSGKTKLDLIKAVLKAQIIKA